MSHRVLTSLNFGVRPALTTLSERAMISTQSPALVQHMVLTIDTVQKIQIVKLFYMFVQILSCGAMEGCATATNTRKEELLEIKRTPDA
jgi:hypothetical protein